MPAPWLPVFPSSLPGETYPSAHSDDWSTITQLSASGLEIAIRLWAYPRHSWELSYSIVQGNVNIPANDMSFSFQTLRAFFSQMGGSAGSFIYLDPNDCATTATGTTEDWPAGKVPALIANGDGHSTYFQIFRQFGGFNEPVYDIVPGTLSVFLNGVPTVGYTLLNSPTPFTGNNGVIQFGSAPGNGVVITATFQFYWRCKFLEDTIDFSNFALFMHEITSLKLYQRKVTPTIVIAGVPYPLPH